MADNVELNRGEGGEIIATDQVDGAQHQYVKMEFGEDGTATKVSEANPLPVSVTNEQVVSTVNSTTTPINDGVTFTGVSELNDFPDVMVSCKADKSGVLYFDFSNDNSLWDTFPSNGFTVTANIHEFHTAVKGGRYFRVRFYNNSGENQGSFRIYTYFGVYRQGNLPLNQSISSDADAVITRGVLVGETDGGVYVNVPATAEGHLEVSIHDPILPFGSLNTESLVPIFQSDAVYGINTNQVLATTGHSTGGVTSGTNTGTNNLFKCSTGTTALSFASIQSRKRLRYRAGQGVVGRFAGYFSTPAANSILVAGFGTGESGYYFGYNGTSFGILHSTGGIREIQTLTVSVGAGGSEDVTVTLGGVATVVAVTAGSTTLVAYQLSKATYVGWDAEQVGSTVIFVANSVGDKAGAFTVASTGTTAGTFAETLAGVASTDVWYPQTEWNGDVCNGTGSASNKSGYDLDPSKGNVFQIDVTYLGFGPIIFKVMTTSDGNNPTYTIVHVLKFPNTRTATTLSQPSFPFTMAAYSAGSTTDVSISVGSFAGFVAGQKKLNGPRMTYSGFSTAVTAAAYKALVTIRNNREYKTRANQAVVNLLSFGGAIEDTTPVTVLLIRNATLAGTPNFQVWSTSSCTDVDTAATTCTFADNAQIIFSLPIGAGASGFFSFEDDITLQPGETVTLAAITVTGTAQYVLATLNTREDQ